MMAKYWKIHAFALVIVVICELVGTKKIPLGAGIVLFLPMLYAMVIGGFISWPRLNIIKRDEMDFASRVLGLLAMSTVCVCKGSFSQLRALPLSKALLLPNIKALGYGSISKKENEGCFYETFYRPGDRDP